MVQNKKVIVMPFFENLVNMVFYTFFLELDYRSQNTPIVFKLINYTLRNMVTTQPNLQPNLT